MDLLALTNRLKTECGASGPALVTCQSQTGESGRMVGWVQEAWLDIARMHEDWAWLLFPFVFTLTPNVFDYTPTAAGLTDFGNWKRDSFRCSSDGTYIDEQLLNYMDYPTYRNLYHYANMRNTFSRPVVVSIQPDKTLSFGPGPSIAYVINGQYYKTPTELSSDTDIPDLPSRFHMAIVYRAMMFYAGFEAAPEVMQRADYEFKRLMNRIAVDQLPTPVAGAPLA